MQGVAEGVSVVATRLRDTLESRPWSVVLGICTLFTEVQRSHGAAAIVNLSKRK